MLNTPKKKTINTPKKKFYLSISYCTCGKAVELFWVGNAKTWMRPTRAEATLSAWYELGYGRSTTTNFFSRYLPRSLNYWSKLLGSFTDQRSLPPSSQLFVFTGKYNLLGYAKLGLGLKVENVYTSIGTD